MPFDRLCDDCHGRNQKIRIETNPPAARISVEGLRHIKNPTPLQFETPGEVVLRRKENHVILRIEKEGYKPVDVILERAHSRWSFIGAAGLSSVGGVLNGLLQGAATGAASAGFYLALTLGIDFATGSAYRLKPSKVSVALEPNASSEKPGGAGRP